MPKVSVDIPEELLEDVKEHVGSDAKFISTSDAIRSSLRKMLDQMDEVDRRRGRIERGKTGSGKTEPETDVSGGGE